MNLTLGTRRIGTVIASVAGLFSAYSLVVLKNHADRKHLRDVEGQLKPFWDLQNRITKDPLLNPDVGSEDEHQLGQYISDVGDISYLPKYARRRMYEKHSKDFNVLITNPYVMDLLLKCDHAYEKSIFVVEECLEFQQGRKYTKQEDAKDFISNYKQNVINCAEAKKKREQCPSTQLYIKKLESAQ